MRRWPFALSLSALAACASNAPHAAAGATPDVKGVSSTQACAEVQCVRDIHVRLKDKDGKPFERTYAMVPVVQPAGVSIYAGQTVRFEADDSNGQLVNLRRVESGGDPARTIEARLEQLPDGGMMLTTRNPFPRPLKIRMGMMLLDSDRLLKTTSCPVIPNGSGFEHWPHPIFLVFLGDLGLLPDSSGMRCE